MKIGILLTGDYAWAGGVYYSLNIIKLLSSVSNSSNNLKIVVIANSATPAEVMAEIPSKNTEISLLDNRSFFYRLIHKIKNDRFEADINSLNLDVLFPVISYNRSHKNLNCSVYYWMYDFQHKFLPALFSPKEIMDRDHNFDDIACNAKNIVFSSNDSQQHFDKFYPRSTAKRIVYNFVSLIKKEIVPFPGKYSLSPQNYFIVCNQFWPHKNHMVVLKALAILLESNRECHIVFTGKYDAPSSKTYLEELNGFIKKKSLKKQVTFSGFISREEQLSLIKNSIAVIQPSLFEGWSTVVEDAKALGKPLVLSDLPVHREQIGQKGLYFSPRDDKKLADHIKDFLNGIHRETVSDYEKNIEVSKNDLIKMFNIVNESGRKKL